MKGGGPRGSESYAVSEMTFVAFTAHTTTECQQTNTWVMTDSPRTPGELHGANKKIHPRLSCVLTWSLSTQLSQLDDDNLAC